MSAMDFVGSSKITPIIVSLNYGILKDFRLYVALFRFVYCQTKTSVKAFIENANAKQSLNNK